MTHPTDDEIMELAGSWFHTGENQKRDDGYYYRSLGTPSNVRGSDLIEFARALLAEQAKDAATDHSAEPSNMVKDAAEDAELLATVECLTDESGTEYVVVLRTKRPTLFGKGHKRESGAQKVADAINSEFGRAAMAQER